MSEPKRIQRKRTKGWRMPENAIYVGRGTVWGNPWRVGDLVLVEAPDWDLGDGSKWVREMPTTPELAVALYRIAFTPDALEIRTLLAEMDLACWCPLDQPCHADVLLEIANMPRATPPDHPAEHAAATVAAGSSETEESSQ